MSWSNLRKSMLSYFYLGEKFMWRKHLFGICLSLLIFSGFALMHLIKYPLTSDKNLTDNFYRNRANFEKLARMANEDKNVMAVYENNVLLDGYNVWQNDSQKGFSTKRWNEYKELFNQLGSPFIHRISKEGDITDIASASIATSRTDDHESIVISKGYAYSLKEPSPLVESLDEMGFETTGTFYKKIGEHWYLYFDSGNSKPE